MEELVQKLKSGEMRVLELSLPALGSGQVLVQNHYSLISSGTEASTVSTARKGYLGKARERPQQVKKVLDSLQEKGVVQTYRAVMKKLEAYSPLGYSCAGRVLAVASDVSELRPGDLVACGGKSASHAEVVAVPVNLCTRLAPDADLKQAAYNTLGAIALQGVRQADLRLGEACVTIGMGLIGQLSALLLKASGVRVVAVDISEDMVKVAAEHVADLALVRSDPGIVQKILEFNGGQGVDAVIITASSGSLDPVNFAGELCRKRGSVVVVGAVPTGFDREPHYYQKELTLKMSCSYGPGRYDPEYEEKGRDYPYGYVRWTERRNMQAFQELLSTGRMDVRHLTSHVFPLEKAPEAFDLILQRAEPFLGILIEYDASKSHQPEKLDVSRRPQGTVSGSVRVGFIGAGSYAQSYLLPNLPKDRVALGTVVTASATSARSVADRYGFAQCSGRAEDILEDPDIGAVFIATRHDSHGRYVIEALRANKHVFVEKPLCLTREEFETISELATAPDAPLLMVGYNRRFSPLTEQIRKAMDQGPLAMVYRVNAGAIPADSWIQDPETGGGRIIGEVCHFIDYLSHLAGSPPSRVFAAAMRDSLGLDDSVSVTLDFSSGCVGTVHYFANGSKSLPKEYVEVYGQGVTLVLNDYRELVMHGRGKPKKTKLLTQDKGQKSEVEAFVQALTAGGPPPIPLEQILGTSRATFAVLDSLRTGTAITL